eukprot:5536434-Pleurochrysis_carterae.AAC.1
MRNDKIEGTCMLCPFAWLRKAIFAFTRPCCQPATRRSATLAAAAIPGRSYGASEAVRKSCVRMHIE